MTAIGSDRDRRALQSAIALTQAAEEMRKRGRDTVKESTREEIPESVLERLKAIEESYLNTARDIQIILQHLSAHEQSINYVMDNGQAVTGETLHQKAG